MLVLAIESSCDETAAAVIENGTTIHSTIVASQVDLHAKYGGIVPEVASREHLRQIAPVVREAFSEAGCTLDDVDAVCATRGPGLSGALLVGYSTGKAIAFGRDLPFLGVNHLEGHVYANWLVEGPPPAFPALCLVVSGGHTDLILMREHGRYERLGGTLDDAAGEAFDKSGRLLGLPFPGGPAISKLAATAGASALSLPRAWLRGTCDFSFSGLKTAVLHAVREERASPAEIAWEFQEAVVDGADRQGLAPGPRTRRRRGVARRRRRRQRPPARGDAGPQPRPRPHPPPSLCTDNAAMIGAVGGHRLALGQRSPLDEDIFSTNDWARV